MLDPHFQLLRKPNTGMETICCQGFENVCVCVCVCVCVRCLFVLGCVCGRYVCVSRISGVGGWCVLSVCFCVCVCVCVWWGEYGVAVGGMSVAWECFCV